VRSQQTPAYLSRERCRLLGVELVQGPRCAVAGAVAGAVAARENFSDQAAESCCVGAGVLTTSNCDASPPSGRGSDAGVFS
jgi:hypothetical protein